MEKNYFIIFTFVATFFVIVYVQRFRIRKWLGRMSIKLQLGSIRNAIIEADKDKDATKRKNIVVFNTDTKKFEPAQKRLLKFVSKNKKQKKVPNGYRQPKSYRTNNVSVSRVKEIEKESVYVTN